LHGFIKKDQKITDKDMDISIERRKKLDLGECDEK
jgi:phage-related protein